MAKGLEPSLAAIAASREECDEAIEQGAEAADLVEAFLSDDDAAAR